jgi:iron complex outermembrane receptor protein
MKDLPALLADLPSTTFYSQNGNGMGYSVLRMRGFGQERIAVSVNGVPQNDPENFNVFWINFFDLKGSVQDVQVQRGAAASSYGSTAVAGAINVVAKPYRPEPYGRVELGVGSFGTRRYTVEANTGRLGDRYVAYGRFSRLVSDGYRDWSWTEYDRYFVGVSRYGERSTLTVQSYGGPQRDGLAFFGVPKDANDDPVARRANPSADERPVSYFEHRGPVEQFHQPHLTVHHNWQWAPNAHLDQRLFWIKGEGYFDFSVNFRSAEFLRLPGGMEGLEDGERYVEADLNRALGEGNKSQFAIYLKLR